MEAVVINPFLTASMDMLDTMFNLKAKAGSPFLMGREVAHRWEISGIIGITGEYHGVVAVRLSRVLANKLLERSGIEVGSDREREETLYGMVGELVNIIAGNASNQIARRIEIAPPVVVYGTNHNIAWPRTIPVIAIPFVTDLGPFEVAVCFEYRDLLRA